MKMTAASIQERQQGLSLVELMVAMVLGLILSAGIIQLFVGSKQTYRFHDAMSRVQENARFAIDALSYDIRMAGDMGCSSYVQNINNTLNGPPPAFNPGAGVQGWEALGTGAGATFNLPAYNAAVQEAGGVGNANWPTSGGAELDTGTWSVPGSDIVRIWRGSGNLATINNIAPGAQTVVNVTPNANINDDDILLLTDCQSSDWVQACNVTAISGGTSINAVLSNGCSPGNVVTAPLLTQAGGQLVKLESFIYYVGKRNNDANSPPGLFRRALGVGVANAASAGTPEEVVEGVESMQVLYGVDTDGDRTVDQYVTADLVGDWATVLSVQIALLMAANETSDDITGAANYTLGDVTANAANDRRLRQVFHNSITLRNRVR
ncbi:MAG: PilW family protein [Gammaproteobacteria bacterium]|nr:PilW family protein [Gammaproteobacteria bacterium]